MMIQRPNGGTPAGHRLQDMLNRLPWDLVYQEWWGEYPPHDRTEHVGLYRATDQVRRWGDLGVLR